jgi:NCS1 family nucleobase:cation symporter-1
MSTRVPNPLTRAIFSGHRPAEAGDLSVETHGITPIAEDQRYGTPRRLFTVWFAPQVNMTGVFTGALAIVLGLGFWLGLLAMVIGSVLGVLIVAYLAVLLGMPFWIAVLIVLGAQGVIGIFGYELIHRLQAALTLVLFTTFAVFAVKLIGGHDVITPARVGGADLLGAFVLGVTIAFSAAVGWATYAADFSRYLPADASRARVFAFTFVGAVLGYIFVDGIGVAAGDVLADHTAEGVRSVMGGGLLGALALVVITLAAIGAGTMTVYSGSLALQTIGVGVRRPVSAVIATVLAFALILWLHAAERAARFQDVLLMVSYWIPAFVAVVVIDWVFRARGRATIDPAGERTDRPDAVAALIAFVFAYAAAIPFMNTTLIEGPIAKAWHGADIAYFVNLGVAAVLYGGYRLMRTRRPPLRTTDH